MKKIIICILILLVNCLCSCAQEVFSQKIETEIQLCMEKENYTTSGMSHCIYKSIPQWEKEIKKYNKLILKKLSSEKKIIFYTNHKQWENYKESQKNIIYEILYSKEGTIYQNISAGYFIDIYKQRILFLKNFYDDIIRE